MRIISALALAGVSLAAIATSAGAQTAPAPASDAQATKDTGIGDIIVTARRKAESLQDVPQTVNVVTATQIDKLNLRNFSDIQSVVPGLTLSGGGGYSTTATVRGVAFNPESSGNNPTIEFYLNDAPISSNFLFQSMFDVGQFELLRGPQGTLRGRASPSGSITVTTRRPDLKEVGLVAEGTVTDRHAYKGDVAFNIPVIKDVLGVRIAGLIDNNRGNDVFTTKALTDPADNPAPYRHTRALRASARFEPTDNLSFNFMYQTLRQQNLQYNQVESASLVDGSAPDGSQIITPYSRLSDQDVGSPALQRFRVFDWSADYHFLGQKLSYVGTYNVQNVYLLGQQDDGDYYNASRITLANRPLADPAGYEAVCANGQQAIGAVTNSEAYFQCTHLIGRRSSHEIRLASEERIAGIFDYVIGGFYDHNENPNALTAETPLLFPAAFGGGIASVNLTSIFTNGRSTEKSAFGNLTAHIGNATELSGGLRYIDYRYFSGITLDGVPPVPDNSDHYHATIFNVSAKHNFSDDLMVYATVGSSWRPGIHVVGDFSVQQSALEQSFINLPPERSKSYEIGLKSSFLNKRGHFNLTFYHQDFNNYSYRGNSIFYVNYKQLAPGFVQPSVSTFNFVAAVPAKVDGVEAEAAFQITPRWNVAGNVSYANGRIKKGIVACNDLNGDGVPDISPSTPTVAELQAATGANNVSQCKFSGPAIFTPKWSANLQSDADIPLSAQLDGFLRGLLTYYPSYGQDPTNAFDNVKGYALINLYAGIRDPDGGWELTFFAKNVLNTQRVLNTSASPSSTSLTTLQFSNTNPPQVTGANSSTYISSYYNVNILPPRELGISFRVAFGSR